MLLNSRGLALILAVSIASIVTASTFLLSDIPSYVNWVVFGIGFGSSYILINIVLEFLFFRELKGIYRMLEEISGDKITEIEDNVKYGHVSLNKIYKEIYSYAQIKQSEIEELKRMAKFRRQFLADVSHELKTPIFAAQGFVHTLLDGAVEDENIRMKFLKKAAKSLDGLDMLVQDLLTVSHMESGDITMQKEYFDICEMVYEIFDQFEEKADRKSVKLQCLHERSSEIPVFADSRRIYQVLVNLVSNAVKYTKDEGMVEVSFDDRDRKVSIHVNDTGIGIPAKDLGRIFERFYRVDKSRSKAKGGTGLGLSIVKHIVEAHGSTVKVLSTVGKGTEFSFELDKNQTTA